MIHILKLYHSLCEFIDDFSINKADILKFNNWNDLIKKVKTMINVYNNFYDIKIYKDDNLLVVQFNNEYKCFYVKENSIINTNRLIMELDIQSSKRKVVIL